MIFHVSKTFSNKVRSSVSDSSLQKMSALTLQQRIVRTAEDRLGLSQSIDFASPCLFANIKILQQPIAFTTKGRNRLVGGGKLSRGRLFIVHQSLECCFCVSLDGFLFSSKLRVSFTLLCGF